MAMTLFKEVLNFLTEAGSFREGNLGRKGVRRFYAAEIRE